MKVRTVNPKILIVLLLIALFVLSPSISNIALADYSGEITVWVSVVEVTENLIEAFKSAYPEYANATIHVESVSESDVAEYLLFSEDAADVYGFAEDQTARLVAAGKLDPVSEVYLSGVTQANSVNSVQAGTIGSTLYAYPMTADNGYFLFYNKSVISDPSTLEGILSACEAAGSVFCMEINSAWYQTAFFFGAGATLTYDVDMDGNVTACHSTYDSEAGVRALKSMEKVAASSAFRNTSSPDGVQEPIGAIVAGTWYSYTMQELWGSDYACAKLPTVDGYQMSGFGGYKLMGVNPTEDQEKRAACQALADFLTNASSQLARYDAAAWGPSNLEAAASERVQSDEALTALSDQLQYCLPQGVYPGYYWSYGIQMGNEVLQGDLAGLSDEELRDFIRRYDLKFNSLAPLPDEELIVMAYVGEVGNGYLQRLDSAQQNGNSLASVFTTAVQSGLTARLGSKIGIAGVFGLDYTGWTEQTAMAYRLFEVGLTSETSRRSAVLVSSRDGTTSETLMETEFVCAYELDVLFSSDILREICESDEAFILFLKEQDEEIEPPSFSFVIPSSAIRIEEEAFAGISADSVWVSGNVVQIGDRAFMDCTQLKRIRIPSSVQTIGSDVFKNVSGLIVYGVPGTAAQDVANAYGFEFIEAE